MVETEKITEKSAKNIKNSEKNDKKAENIENSVQNNDENISENNEKNSVSQETKSEFKMVWGNPKALVMNAGALILAVLATVFFGVRMTATHLFDETTLTICKVMFGLVVAASVVILVMLIVSVVLFVRNKKEPKVEQ